jgi:HD superfamily phosphohydrolase YqeK
MNKINHLILEMFDFNSGEPELIQHFIKVHEFAKLIANMENISSENMEILEVATIVHDIGIKLFM